MTNRRDEIKRQIRFNLDEISGALAAHDINIASTRLARMQVGDLIAVLTHEKIGVLIGAYVRPYTPDLD